MTMDLATVEFSADLHCEIDSCPLTIRGADRTIVVEVPDVATGLKILRLGLPRGSRRRRLHTVKACLDDFATALEIRLAGKPIVTLGHNVGSRWWRLLGLPALSLRSIPWRLAYRELCGVTSPDRRHLSK